MFTPLYSSTNQELLENHVCILTVATMKNMMVPRAPVTAWNLSIHCPSLSAMFDSLHSSTNQEVFEKHLCNKSSHYENTDDFSLRKGSHHVQPPN